MLLSIGDQIRPGTYRLHSSFSRALNFESRGRLVSVVVPTIGPGPFNIVLRDLKPEVLHGAESLTITSTYLALADRRYAFDSRHRYDSTLSLLVDRAPRFHRNLSLLGEWLKTTASPKSLAFLLDETRLTHFHSAFERALAKRVSRAVYEVFHGDMLAGIRALKGCGPGLTPSGDDFIAGLLIGLYLLKELYGRSFESTAKAICAAAQGDNLFSNTFLELACRGLLFGHMKTLVLALLVGHRASVRKATDNLLVVGASSGADLATGFVLTLQNYLYNEAAFPVASVPEAQHLTR